MPERPLIPAFGTPRPWWRDPLVAVGAVLAMTLHGWAFFAGEYLPYIDWSNHLGLISVLAHGGETGALDVLERRAARLDQPVGDDR